MRSKFVEASRDLTKVVSKRPAEVGLLRTMVDIAPVVRIRPRLLETTPVWPTSQNQWTSGRISTDVSKSGSMAPAHIWTPKYDHRFARMQIRPNERPPNRLPSPRAYVCAPTAIGAQRRAIRLTAGVRPPQSTPVRCAFARHTQGSCHMCNLTTRVDAPKFRMQGGGSNCPLLCVCSARTPWPAHQRRRGMRVRPLALRASRHIARPATTQTPVGWRDALSWATRRHRPTCGPQPRAPHPKVLR